MHYTGEINISTIEYKYKAYMCYLTADYADEERHYDPARQKNVEGKEQVRGDRRLHFINTLEAKECACACENTAWLFFTVEE